MEYEGVGGGVEVVGFWVDGGKDLAVEKGRGDE